MTLQQVDGKTPPSPSPGVLQSLSGLIPKPIQDMMRARQEQAWAGWVDEQYYKCKNARQPFERQWHLNMAFYMGRQYVAPLTVSGQGFRLTVPKAPPWRVRLVINKIRTAVRVECSKLTSSKPIPTVVPATTEDEDFAAARVAEQILRTEFLSREFEQVVKSWVWWGVVTGNSFIKSFWDPSAKDPMNQKPPQELIPGMPPMQLPTPTGKIVYERVNPFHVYVPDLLTEEVDKQPYLIHVSTRTPQWVKNVFGFDANPDALSTDSTLDAAMLGPAATNQVLDSVLVKEMWLKAGTHPDFPEGGVITVVNNRCVQVSEKWPYTFFEGEYPFYKYNGIPTGGFYTESSITDLIPLQKEYNRTRSQMVEIKNTMGKPKLLAARGSINPRQVSSEPGQAVLWNPGFPAPVPLPAAEVPSSMVNEIQTLTNEFDDISGQHEISRGGTPNSQITSGTAISFLQEQDDSKLAYQVSGIEQAIQKLGSHYLKYAENFWTDERLLRIVGSDGNFEAKHWKGSELKGNTDVRIQSGSALPFSKAARQALITEMMQNQWLSPESGMEIMELSGFEKVLEDSLVDKRQAQRENLRLADAPVDIIKSLVEPPPNAQMMTDPATNNEVPVVTGPDGMPMPWQPQSPLPVNSYDNHEAHIYFHNQFRKTQQFEMLDESLKKAFELHVQTHQMALMNPQMGEAGPVGGAQQPNPDPNAQQQQDPNMQVDPNAQPTGPQGATQDPTGVDPNEGEVPQ